MMMIEVKNLVKRYAGLEAVKGISFEVAQGEIVGFLGPNGAGKSTTMRILAGFLPATEGTVRVAGFDIFQNSIEVRRRVGYMPEMVPLYTEMTVNEFLNYRARLKGVRGKKVGERVDYVKEVCDLKEAYNRIIGTLSKGFRQRVALADAIVHDPDLLILDEPTIGLDPNQIRQVRELIKSLGQKHTVLISTHILPEVEMTCQRVLIINKGRIEASDSPDNLTRHVRSGGGTKLEVRASSEAVRHVLSTWNELEEVVISPLHEGWLQVEAFAKRGEDLREKLFHCVSKEGWGLRELTRHRATLEDVFVELTHEDKV
jgi:ABC-2 type transport system ATP-binding protein